MKNSPNKLIRSSLFLAIAIIFQVIGRSVPQINQLFVGPIVNTVLILTAYICGTFWGIGVGILTPILAWVIGQLAAPFAPFIPFIIIGNAIFVATFGVIRKYKIWGPWAGIIIGAFLKYVFLYLSASKLVTLFKLGIPSKMLSKLIMAMGIPQLITALIGGILAMVIIKLLQKRSVI